MIARLIRFFLSNYPLTFFLIGLVCALVRISRHRVRADYTFVVDSLLSYYCLWAIGLFYVYNFVMHVFFPQLSAHFIGWADSPFQREVGFASLGTGVIGILAKRNDFSMRLAAILASGIFNWGAAIGHSIEIFTNHNLAPGNAGVIFYTDWLVPAVGVILLYMSRPLPSVPTYKNAIT
jgi:hypothetical protein